MKVLSWLRPTARTDQAVNCSSKQFRCEVVGESKYQPEIRRLVEAAQKLGSDLLVVSVLHDAGNKHDANALAVIGSGLTIGYLPSEAAATLAPAVLRFRRNRGQWPSCYARPSTGGSYGTIGIWLDLDLGKLDLSNAERDGISWYAGATRNRPGPSSSGLRTGFGEADSTDIDDDSYDLSWAQSLADDTATAVAQLRTLLASHEAAIERHYMFIELEQRLYKLRDSDPTSLVEYDAVCQQHDAEMDSIVVELKRKFGAVPLLETYRQCCIRHQKARNYVEGLRWAERGLSLYGEAPVKLEWAADLQSRADKFRALLARDANQ